MLSTSGIAAQNQTARCALLPPLSGERPGHAELLRLLLALALDDQRQLASRPGPHGKLRFQTEACGLPSIVTMRSPALKPSLSASDPFGTTAISEGVLW